MSAQAIAQTYWLAGQPASYVWPIFFHFAHSLCNTSPRTLLIPRSLGWKSTPLSTQCHWIRVSLTAWLSSLAASHPLQPCLLSWEPSFVCHVLQDKACHSRVTVPFLSSSATCLFVPFVLIVHSTHDPFSPKEFLLWILKYLGIVIHKISANGTFTGDKSWVCFEALFWNSYRRWKQIYILMRWVCPFTLT